MVTHEVQLNKQRGRRRPKAARQTRPGRTPKSGAWPRIASIPSVAVVVVAVALVSLPVPRASVERWYASGFYTLWQPAATRLSNLVPFALLDVLIIVSLLWLGATGTRDIARKRGWRGSAAAGWRLAVFAASVYIAFLAAWGFNYRRVPMAERVPFDERAVNAAAASRLASLAVERLNRLHGEAHAEPAIDPRDPRFTGAFDRVARALGATGTVAIGRPKRSILDWYFQRAGVSGMTDPFFLETLLASDLLPFERPFVIAHEWSHLAGLADEGEANVAGWLACLGAPPAHQYSGWLFMYGELARVLERGERAALSARLALGPREDLQAIRDRLARHVSPRLSGAGWRVYDSYLKANRVEAGTASYDEVVRLALGLRVQGKP